MPKTLLLADDSVVIQKLVGLSFANEDVELVTTDNGDDALARARELRPDLVLADVVMPGKNGYEVCQLIKDDPQLNTTPVLLLTGTFEAFDEDRARQVGSDGHITKPFEAQGLVDRVTDLLSRPRPAPVAAAPPAPQPAPQPTAQAAPQALQPEMPATPVAHAAPAASNDDSYDFFDEDVQELAAPEVAAPNAPPTAPATPRPMPPAAATPSPMPSATPPPTPPPMPSATPPPTPSPAPSPALNPDDSFEFGADLDPLSIGSPTGESETLDTNFELDSDTPDDLTVAVVPEPPASAPPPLPVDPGAPEATRISMAETVVTEGFEMPAAPPPVAAPTPIASLDARLGASAEPPQMPSTPPPVADLAETMLADDLFADPVPAQPAEPAPPPVPETPAAPAAMPPAMDSGFEFGVDEPIAPPQAAAPEPMTPGPMTREPIQPTPVAPEVMAPEVMPPDLSMGRDPLRDDLDPLAGMSPETDPLASSFGMDAPAAVDAAGSTHSGYDVSASDLGDPLAGSGSGLEAADLAADPMAAPALPEPPALDPVAEAVPLSPELLPEAPTTSPDLSPMMQDRIHETLEKVAWEAFADVSDTIVRQVLQRVESIVWEVVPQMAETLIQEEIRRMKGEE